ncbi:EamA family transporter [Desulforamulus putei]|uniref:EamA family transporter n=1 Tax=Desulforamulus putei TaxID=74701 RepID=UPI002FDDB6A8
MSNTTQVGLATQTSSNWVVFFHLLVVYIVWGSTYLAIRVAVREGSGFPPFTMGALRLLFAGCILLLGAFLFRQALKLSWQEFKILAVSGIFLWIGGNGLVMWAEQFADSGYAALLVGTTPMWVALTEAVLDRKSPSKLFVVSLLIGFAGIALLTTPVLKESSRADVLSVIALLTAPLSWGLGSLLQRRKPVSLSPIVSSGYQQVFGGIGFAVLAFVLGEPSPTPTAEAWWAFGYLVVFGSFLAFTSFIMALRLLPTSIVMTYAYVNPVVAVFLGWLILHEPINIWTFAGTALVLLGVAGTFRNQKTKPRVQDKTADYS